MKKKRRPRVFSSFFFQLKKALKVCRIYKRNYSKLGLVPRPNWIGLSSRSKPMVNLLIISLSPKSELIKRKKQSNGFVSLPLAGLLSCSFCCCFFFFSFPIRWASRWRRWVRPRRRGGADEVPWRRPHPIPTHNLYPEEVFGYGFGLQDPVPARTRLWRLRFLSRRYLHRSLEDFKSRWPGLLPFFFWENSRENLTYRLGGTLGLNSIC